MTVFAQTPLSRCSVGALVVILSVAGEVGGRAERASQELEAIRQFYLAIHSVHLKARADISRTIALSPTQTQTQVGTGELEYWEAGNLFRSDTRTSPELGLIDDMDAAYDGSVSQLIRYFSPEPGSTHRPSLLFLSAGRHNIPSPVPNPLFLPVDFVKITVENCPACQPGLSELRGPDLWQKATANAQVSGSSTGDVTLELPTGFLHGKTFSYVADKEAGRALPSKVRWVDAEGNELVSIVMTSERNFAKQGKDFTFPTRFIIRDSWSGTTIDIVIEELEVGGHIDPAIFKLDRSGIDMIWDHDLAASVKTIASRPEP